MLLNMLLFLHPVRLNRCIQQILCSLTLRWDLANRTLTLQRFLLKTTSQGQGSRYAASIWSNPGPQVCTFLGHRTCDGRTCDTEDKFSPQQKWDKIVYKIALALLQSSNISLFADLPFTMWTKTVMELMHPQENYILNLTALSWFEHPHFTLVADEQLTTVSRSIPMLPRK